MQGTELSLKWLEVFQRTATLGSVRAVAKETGLSISTVSHHLRSLETKLGVNLLDHKRRPMVLTPAGREFLKYIEQALMLIRKGQAEVMTGNVYEARMLRLGLIEDFDNEIGPDLAVRLAKTMPQCNFTHRTRSSHEILDFLRRRAIDIGIANVPIDGAPDLQETPFLRDPFVLALPVNCQQTPAELLEGLGRLPFLRYDAGQIISHQIETQLRRLKINLPRRFEIESNQTLMAMIAEGGGWAITTPMCYMRASRFHAKVKLFPFPEKAFARSISIFATPECAVKSQQLVQDIVTLLIEKRALQPAFAIMPWLEGHFGFVSQAKP